MAESHATSNALQVNGSLQNIGSELNETSKSNGLSAPAHSRTGSSDSGEGLLLSASGNTLKELVTVVSKLRLI